MWFVIFLDDLYLTFSDKLPVEECFRLIEQRFTQKLALKKLHKGMEVDATQFRIIQKKVLQRFKVDKVFDKF